MSKTSDVSPVGRVPGAESGRRLLRVLLSFTEHHPVWTVADLAETLNMNSSMVYRYIALLREVGLVATDGSGKLSLTEIVDGLSAAASKVNQALDKDILLPVISTIRDEVGETVLVARRSEWRVFTVVRAESYNPVRLQFEAGQPMALHSGALSRVLLAAMPNEDRKRYLAQLSEHELLSPGLQPEVLESTLQRGYAESFSEVDEGIWGSAAPIYKGNVVVAAVGCASPLYRTDESKRTQIRRAIVAGAAAISAALNA